MLPARYDDDDDDICLPGLFNGIYEVNTISFHTFFSGYLKLS